MEKHEYQGFTLEELGNGEIRVTATTKDLWKRGLEATGEMPSIGYRIGDYAATIEELKAELDTILSPS